MFPALPRLSTATTSTWCPSARRALGEPLDHPFHAAGPRPVVLREVKNSHGVSRQVHHDPRSKSTGARPLVPAPAGRDWCRARPRDLSRLRRPRRPGQAPRAGRPRRHRRGGRARPLGAGGAGATPADHLGRRRRRTDRAGARFGAARSPPPTRSGTAGRARGCSTDFRPESVQIEEEPGATARRRSPARRGGSRSPMSCSPAKASRFARRARRAAPESCAGRGRGIDLGQRDRRPARAARPPLAAAPHHSPVGSGAAAVGRTHTSCRTFDRVRRPADSRRRGSTCCSARP